MKKVAFFIVFLFLSCASTFGATYTVCSSGCDNTTITGALDAIDLAPDDVIEVRADTEGGAKSYTETVTPAVGDSGTEGHPVILRARAGDAITIDGENTRDSGVVLTNVNYLTVRGFIFSNHTGQTIYGRSSSAKAGWTIDNCTINISLSNGPDATANQGIGLSGVNKNLYVSKVVIDNNLIQTGAGSLNEQTDGITLYYIDNAIVRNNTINLQNYDNNATYQHVDGIQAGTVKNLTIYNNSVYLDRNHENGQQGIYLEGIDSVADAIDLGTYTVYNNLISGPDWGSTAVGVFQKNDTISTFYFYNNTVVETYASTRSIPFRTDVLNAYFKNNILKTERSNILASFDNATQVNGRINNNLYYNPPGDVVSIGGSAKSWAEWQALGYDANGVNTDPLFVGAADFSLQAGSPAINAGATLGSPYNVDITGKARPQGGLYDLGAYEYGLDGVEYPTSTGTISGSWQ